jgi:hypothetical protein
MDTTAMRIAKLTAARIDHTQSLPGGMESCRQASINYSFSQLVATPGSTGPPLFL